MAGHSKWANIRHRKGLQDAKRGKMFTKIQKEIAVAVKIGGPDMESNPRLRAAVQGAGKVNMPKDNIERAIKKASGEGAAAMVETTFEGHGPGGAAVFVECTTDNKMRTVSNVRHYFSKYGGSLGKDGTLRFVFDRKAVFVVPAEGRDEEEFTLELIDMGAEDVELEEGEFTVIAPMEEFGNLQRILEGRNIECREAALRMIPGSYQSLDADKGKAFMKLIDALEDDDDVQRVYHNLEFDERFAEL